ncbi:hypothetical protein NXF25_018949 [Crotalus adamanteus]|uniref:Uncharacterized protein n=1 Tax=Crotalus adamanteus TaxID=8729 RepID=A0AAW1B0R9_CROAD
MKATLHLQSTLLLAGTEPLRSCLHENGVESQGTYNH